MSDPRLIEASPHECWVAGAPEPGETALSVVHPYDGTEIGTAWAPGARQVEHAATAAARCAMASEPLRTAALRHVAEQLTARTQEVAELLTAETGLPLRATHVEVERATQLCLGAARHASVGHDEPRYEGTRLVITTRRLRGPVLAVAGREEPLAGAAEMLAPALAVGAPVVVVPDPHTPLSALLLGELLGECSLPPGVFSILPPAAGTARALLRDDRLPVVAAGTDVVMEPAGVSARKHVVERGASGTTALLCADWTSDDDVNLAAAAIARSAHGGAGRTRTAVRRLLVDTTAYAGFLPALLDAVRALPTGAPHDPRVEVGPLPDEGAADRLQDWVDGALDAGGELTVGGGRHGTTLAPTVLCHMPAHSELWERRVAGPVLGVSEVDDLDGALGAASDPAPGAGACVFTHDMRTASACADRLTADEIVIGDTPHADPALTVATMAHEYTRPQRCEYFRSL